jgi:hypothetical protein
MVSHGGRLEGEKVRVKTDWDGWKILGLERSEKDDKNAKNRRSCDLRFPQAKREAA